MANTRIRTLNFLPEVFKTEINSQFLSATLDVLTSEPKTTKIEGHIGDTLGFGIDAKSSYVIEATKTRNNYQLDPGVVFLRKDSDVAKDFISYPGIIDALALEGGITDNHSRLFNSQFYSWDSFVDIDKLNNFYQYYWLPSGPDSVDINSATVFIAADYVVTDKSSGYFIQSDTQHAGVMNPTIYLMRGGVYTFAVKQESLFWIQGEPGLTGFSLSQPNVSTRDILGIDRNGINSGFLTFTVPTKDAQEEYSFPGQNVVDLVSTMPFAQLNGIKLAMLPTGIDGITSLDGRTVMFYNTGIPQEKGFVTALSVASSTPDVDVTIPNVLPKTISVGQTISGSNILRCESTADLVIGTAITFSAPVFGGVDEYIIGDTSPPSDPNPSIPQTIYFVNSILDDMDFTISLTPSTPISYSVTETKYNGNKIIMSDTSNLTPGDRVYFVGATYANITEGSYYVLDILTSTSFTISSTRWGSALEVIDWTGEMTLLVDVHKGTVPLDFPVTSYISSVPMIGNINEGLYEEGKYTDVNSTFYTIQLLIDSDNPHESPTVRLVDTGYIPINEKITAQYGTQWINRDFYRNILDYIVLMPYFSSVKDVLYYQDGTTPSKVGTINLVDSNSFKPIDIDIDIIGKKNYLSPNNVKFTNGLKVTFSGDIIPASYLNKEFYVEGVGTAIELVPVLDLVAPEGFTSGEYIPYDSNDHPYDSTNYDTNLYAPPTPDYLTIAKHAKNKNAWTRSNRWFHTDVISAVATYNNDPSVLTRLATHANKAKRPILEFYPNLKLFNSGTIGKKPIDFLDTRTTDAFNRVAGQSRYYPDVETYTDYTATIDAVAPISGIVDQSTSNVDDVQVNTFHTDSPVGFHKNDRICFFASVFGGVEESVILLEKYVTYYIKDVIDEFTFTISATKNGEVFPLVTATGSMSFTLIPFSTWVYIPTIDIFGSSDEIAGKIIVGHYVDDSFGALPFNSYVTELSVSEVSGLTTLLVSWDTPTVVEATNDSSLAFGAFTLNNFVLFDGARIVFANDTTSGISEKIFVAKFSTVDNLSPYVITLTEATDGEVIDGNQLLVLRGFYNANQSFYIDTTWDKNQQKFLPIWKRAQQKSLVNQPPLFDIFDSSNISLSDEEFYHSTSFRGTKLFGYGVGSGSIDPVLGVPLKYSSVDNIGDISFEIFLNSDTFTYVSGKVKNEELINVGYVHSYTTTTDFSRHLGWQTTIDKSIQYQVFEFPFWAAAPTQTFLCDVAMQSSSAWTPIQLYVNNRIQDQSSYSYVITDKSTTVTFSVPDPTTDTVIQILLLSPQVSTTAYYGIPINLNNNPLNEELKAINMGDFRRHYDSIFSNAVGTLGYAFGPNNSRDLGNLVPYGTRLIQNSASLVLSSVFLRKQNLNLLNALAFNSREYINFKSLLINTANDIEYSVYQTPAYMLDAAIEQITAAKTEDKAFFWSDMLPAKIPFISNIYTFSNTIETTVYPLCKIYDYSKANYSGILVYLTRRENRTTQTVQLLRGVDYTVSSEEALLTITKDLVSGDIIEIKEFNQTYGSFVPNTPTKLGLYPATQPKIVQDAHYMKPAWFVVGHDGSYTKLYGTYDPSTDHLSDFRDQVLLEFEKRIYNNIKTDAQIPIKETEVVPGFFRDTGFDLSLFNHAYQISFLTWIGHNKLSYKTQVFSTLDEFTYNYSDCTNKIDNTNILPGYWRGVYQYFYDTTTPDVTPWEMLHFRDKPLWWDTRYGPAPYTCDNKILWNDLAEGKSWNNGSPVVIANAVRPGLLDIIPVDSSGKLLSPYISITKNYASAGWQRDWKVGDMGPTEFSYRRSSSWPFDLMRLMALTKPAEFYNLGVDLDNYGFNEEFQQYLVNNRYHLKLSELEIYGSGTAKTSYLNWIVDFEKQFGIDATSEIKNVLDNLDVRLVYRLAGFSDKNLLKFYVEKSTINSKNSSLLIPDDSYSVILYDNQPSDRIVYSSVIIQLTESGGWLVNGNSQVKPYFNTCPQKHNRFYQQVKVEDVVVKMYDEFYDDVVVPIPYGTVFYSLQEVSQFLANYGRYLETQGMKFETIDYGVEINWMLMVREFLYWAQTGWSTGSLITLNPAAKNLTIDKENNIVQPLTNRQHNFILNQNQYIIQLNDLAVNRNGTSFTAQPMKDGDTLSYGVFNLGSIEHGIVFDNRTIFNDVIYAPITGIRQNRIIVKGTKSAEWNGTLDAQGFILNQDNVLEWNANTIYVAGSIVTHRNKYWTTMVRLPASPIFDIKKWIETPYEQIQKGLLPNPATRAYESSLYYDTNQANLEDDGDLLAFSLIGYRPREYMSSADLSDVTQVNVYKNLIKNKGTLTAANMFKDAKLKQGIIDYDIYENWAIKTGEFGGVMASNFVEIKLNSDILNHNPSTIELTNGDITEGVTQEVSLYSIYNYGRSINSPYILPVLTDQTIQSSKLPYAGYVNFDDAKLTSYFYSDLSTALDKNGQPVGIEQLHIGDFVWVANHENTWQVFTPASLGKVVKVINNLTGIFTIVFGQPHGLIPGQLFAILNFDTRVNGYHTVKTIIDQFKITIALSISQSNADNIITGLGVGFVFNSQRVATPSDILNLPLLPYEFTDIKVWVDTNVDNSWAVFQKSINYQYQKGFTKEGSSKFGSAVAFSADAGFVIGDSGDGKIYRYKLNPFNNKYALMPDSDSQQGSTFGTTIEHAKDIFVVSDPTGEKLVHIYRMIVTQEKDELVWQYSIQAPIGVDSWGDTIALSGDTKWLYISDIPKNDVHIWRLSDTTGEYAPSSILHGASLDMGTNYMFGSSLSTDYYGKVLVIGAPNVPSLGFNPVDGWGKAFVYHRIEQTIEVPKTQPQYYPLAWTPQTIYVTVTETNGSPDVNTVTCNSTAGFRDYSPISFYADLTGTGIIANAVYYILPGFTSTSFKLVSKIGDTQPLDIGGGVLIWSVIAAAQINTDVFTQTPITVTVTSIETNSLVSNTPLVDFKVGQAIIFTSGVPEISGLVPNNVYYILNFPDVNSFSLVESISDVIPIVFSDIISCSMIGTLQAEPLFVKVNGQFLRNTSYAIVDDQLMMLEATNVGDIIEISTPGMVFIDEFDTGELPHIGSHFGTGVATNFSGSEILIGAPFEMTTPSQNNINQEGAVFRFTDGGSKYGMIIGNYPCNLASPIKILLNDYLVILPAGNSADIAASINKEHITNIMASSIDGNKLIIQLIDDTLSTPNNKLSLTVLDAADAVSLGLSIYTKTQIVYDPHKGERTQFGSKIKFNEFGSFVVSAPAAIRLACASFDSEQTIFDNASTLFLDSFPDAGAVFMFDYVPTSVESLSNPGCYLFAQNINDISTEYGSQPMYGHALDFVSGTVMVGTPNYRNSDRYGQVIHYQNSTTQQDWSVHRKTSPVIDINGIKNTMLFDAKTNLTQINLDYFDPLQGKLLGAVRENLDFISVQDPAGYNSPNTVNPGAMVWASEKIGKTWLCTTNIRFINYHQNDIIYNGKHWGGVFPGSDVAVYSWVSSGVLPKDYVGPGKPYDVNMYSTIYNLTPAGNLLATYYFWVRNTNKIIQSTGKTLSDSILEQYIAAPQSSGISYFSALDQNIFALYNCSYNQNSVLHLGFSTGTSPDDVQSNLYNLIRSEYRDDFLPGLPKAGKGDSPKSLYNKLIDSLCGVSASGMTTNSELGIVEHLVPNPYLPKSVQYGINTRPSQSFFIDNLEALKNYLEYANSVLIQHPISESKRSVFLYKQGKINPSTGIPFFDTTEYWTNINWWADGYTNNTRVTVQVDRYANLAELNASEGIVAKVKFNGNGNWEVYINTSTGWQRIGLQNGTIQFSNKLWDYVAGNTGFGESFFDTDVFSIFPSEETRNILRALNEEIYTNELLMHRNKSLMLIFEYIQSESAASQNYLPWLNKTSLVDVSHTVRPLDTVSVYQDDNQTFLEGFINEVKPYHVVIKEFLFKYSSNNVYSGTITDFDLPSQWDNSTHKFSTPAIEYVRFSVNFSAEAIDSAFNTISITPYSLSRGDLVKYEISNPMQSLDVLVNGQYYYVGIITEYPNYTVALYLSIEDMENDRNRVLLTPKMNGALIAYDRTVGTTLPSDPIWNSQEYSEWNSNFGVSISGVKDYPIATLVSYIGSNSNSFVVSNASGFPINGIVLIGDEYIGYNIVTRETNTLSGLQRGYDGSIRADHIPGDTIIMDLPAVMVLDGGRGYVNPPIVTAWIDTTKYPEPRRAAILHAEMYLDSILRIVVDDPGSGYAVLPKINIVPSVSISFANDQVNVLTNTITILKPAFVHGDLVKFYQISEPAAPSGLKEMSYYYVGILESEPLISIALYYTRNDVVDDRNRVTINSVGSGVLEICARASCVSDSSPVRENQMTLRFDRTTYNTEITDWVTGAYYGTFFAGELNNSAQVASSSIKLRNVLPDIETIESSATGGTFEINKVNSSEIIEWSSVLRKLVHTENFNNTLQVMPLGYESLTMDELNYITPTLGFTIGMPVKFVGPSSFSGTNIQENTVYYVASITSNTHFSIKDIDDNIITVDDGTISSSPGTPQCYCYTGTIKNDLTLQLDYTGIPIATKTTAKNNVVTVPLTLTGKGGTLGLHAGSGITFTRTRIASVLQPMFTSIIENDQYYVTTVFDDQTFSMSTNSTPHTLQVVKTIANDPFIEKTNVIECKSTIGLVMGDPVTFSDMIVNDYSVSKFGGLQEFIIYYVGEIHPGDTKFTVTDYNNNIIILTDEIGSCSMVNQRDVVKMVDEIGNVNLNIGFPISPGQINGQQFTLYNTSSQYEVSTETIGGLLTRTVVQGVSAGTIGILALESSSGGSTDIYLNMPFTLSTSYGGLLASPTIYYASEVGILVTEVVECSNEYFICDSITDGSRGTYGFYSGMPIIFSQMTLGAIDLEKTYYVHEVLVDGYSFSIKNEITDSLPILLYPMSDGKMVATGAPYITVSDESNSAPILIGNDVTTTTITQTIIDQPEFIVSYVLGGYRFIATTPGRGFAIGNSITIPGNEIGGINFENDLSLLVTEVNLNVQCSLTESISNIIHCESTYGFVVDDPISFTKMSIGGADSSVFGGINVDQIYYVNTIETNTTFTIKSGLTDTIPAMLSDQTGSMWVNNNNGSIISAIASGTPAGIEKKYYFKVISEREVAVYYDANLILPVQAKDFDHRGILSTQTLSTTSSGVTVTDTTGFSLNEPIVFTGNVFGGLVLGIFYYISAILPGNIIVLSETSNGPPLSDLTPMEYDTTSAPCYCSANGDFAFLPEPFYFTQSLVRLNHHVYQCIVSNNDDVFVLGKWQLLRPDDRRLNALDRIFAFYQPTPNMPGLDMSQLVSGITYPNNVYRGDAFAPDDHYPIDTILKNIDFRPSNINTAAIVWNGIGYVAAGDTNVYSGIVTSADTSEWAVYELMPTILGVTDMIYTGSMYVVTTSNVNNPVIISPDGISWISNGEYTPFGALPYDELPYDMSSINVANIALSAVAHFNDLYVAVGSNLITSYDAYSWTEQFVLASGSVLNGVFSLDVSEKQVGGFIAVGYIGSSTLLLTSFNSGGLIWTPSMWVPTITWSGNYSHALNTGAHSSETITVLGDNGVRLIGRFSNNFVPFSLFPYDMNSYDNEFKLGWSVVSSGYTTVTSTELGTNYVTVGETSGLEIGSVVKFENASGAFGGISVDVGYFVKNIINSTTLTISTSVGSTVLLSNWSGAAKITNTISIKDVTFAQNIAVTKILSTSYPGQYITVDNPDNIEVGDPIVITTGAYGGLINNRTYYVKSVDFTYSYITVQEYIASEVSPEITTTVTATNASTNYITCADTTGFTSGRGIYFTGTAFGNIPVRLTTYIKDVIDEFTFTISVYSDGPIFQLITDTGIMTAVVLAESVNVLTDVVLSDGQSVEIVTNPEGDYLVENYPLISKAVFVAVGKGGVIQTSFDGITWKNRNSGTTENITSVAYSIRIEDLPFSNSDIIPTGGNITIPNPNNYDMSNFDARTSTFELVAATDNDVVLKSTNGITWKASYIFAQPDMPYIVKGDEFIAGYGPEEMVPGVVEDNLMMTVRTRPGSSWQFYEYNTFGFNVVSSEIVPT